ncbi:class I SAM-dependent methyltransferase [Rhizobium sp. PAMB 3182]
MAEVDRHYSDPALAALYDLDSGWGADRQYFLDLAGVTPIRVLDLGCGTGLLSRAYAARGHRVTAVDPALPMIEIGRREPHGEAIEWVCSNAETFRSEERFDLIVMTGNAFQVFLTEEAVRALFATMRLHLADGGRVVFETRNPAIDWPTRWNHDHLLETKAGPITVSRRILSSGNGFVDFETRYIFPDRETVSTSRLRFFSPEAIQAEMASCGLVMKSLQGDFSGEAFDATRHEEMVFVAASAL